METKEIITFDDLPAEIKIKIGDYLYRKTFINYGEVLFKNYNIKLDLDIYITDNDMSSYSQKFNIKKLSILNNQDKIDFPDTLTHLILNYFVEFKRNPIQNFLLDNLKTLIIKTSYKIPEIKKWPSKLDQLSLPSNYNYPIDNLPETLTWLTLGTEFNKPINNLPNNLLRLEINVVFDQLIDNLPESLRTLEFWNCSTFNQPINNLPINLNYLKLGNGFNHSLDYLPKNLSYLEFNSTYTKTINNLPQNLK